MTMAPTLMALPAAVTAPLAVLTLAALASSMFTRGPRHHTRAVVALVAAAVLALLGAHWIVFPAAAICLAVVATYIWGRRSKSWRPLTRAIVGVVVFAMLGAHWVVVPLGWVLVGAFFFTRGGVCGGGRQRVRTRYERRPMTPPKPATEEGPTVDLSKKPGVTLAQASHDIRIPQDCRVRAGRLLERCDTTLDYLRERGLDTGRHGYQVEAIRDNFGPEAIGAYLALPPAMANVEVLEDGKTGHDLLREQLDLLLDGVEHELKQATRIGGEALLASQRFLRDKFGKKSDDLNL